MDVTFTDEQIALRDMMADFVRKEVPREKDREYDRQEEFPYDLLAKMTDVGLTGMFTPEEYGGIALSPVSIALAIETLTYGSIAASAVIIPTSLVTQLLVHGGTEEQKAALLPGIAQGKVIASFGLSEPHSGSDATSLRTRATRDGDHWVIQGSKMWSSSAHVATHLIVAARTDATASKKGGISVFIIDPKTPGVSISLIDTIGSKSTGTCQVFYDDVRIPADAVLGGEEGINQGWRFLNMSLSLERLELASLSLGLGQRALDDAIEFVNNREAFGQVVGKFQAIQHMVADLATRLEAGRALTYRAAALMEAGLPHTKEVVMAKVFVSELVKEICISGMQMLGGYGYTRDFDMERYFRRAALQTIGGGTTQVLRNVLAKQIGM